MTDYDPRLVELYDDDNPNGPDHDFYRSLAEELGATSICAKEIENQLASAGFRVEAVYGDWHHSPFTIDAALMVFVARAA